jgi:hypothetical protein
MNPLSALILMNTFYYSYLSNALDQQPIICPHINSCHHKSCLYTIEKGSAYALNQNKIKSSDAAAIETTTA